jgi:hypothetical protein
MGSGVRVPPSALREGRARLCFHGLGRDADHLTPAPVATRWQQHAERPLRPGVTSSNSRQLDARRSRVAGHGWTVSVGRAARAARYSGRRLRGLRVRSCHLRHLDQSGAVAQQQSPLEAATAIDPLPRRGACRSSATSRRRRATGSASTPVGPAAPRDEAGAAVLELPAIVEVEGRGAKAVATKDGPVVDEGAVAVTVQRAPAAGHPAEDLVRLDSPAFPAQDLQPRRPGRSASAADVFRRLLLWAPRFSL